MFRNINLREQIDAIWRHIKGYRERLEKLEEIYKDYKRFIECEKCHCLIERKGSNKGESTIEMRNRYNQSIGVGIISYKREEQVVHHYFCGRCIPKKKKK